MKNTAKRSRAFRGRELTALFFVFFSLMAMTGCSSDDETIAAVEVQIERIPEAQSFRVTWHVPKGAKALVFARRSVLNRHKSWTAEVPGQRIQLLNGRESLLSDQVTKKFSVLIPEMFSEVVGDYPLMTKFSDGSVLLYSGYFNAVGVNCLDACSEGELQISNKANTRIDLLVQPASSERVMVGTRSSSVAFQFSPPAEGAFVYFGQRAPIHGPGYSIITDPRLPAWILPEVERYLGQILSLNNRKLNLALPETPMFFIPYESGARKFTLTQSGAVVGNQVVLALFGNSWERRTPEAREELLKLLAHESFHLWNASLYHSEDRPGGRWLHEGSADAFSLLTLLEVGAMTKKRYLELQTESLNRCLVGLGGTDLPSSNTSWSSRNHYNCGAVIQQLLGHALDARGSDLWSLWAQILNRAASKNGFYTHDDFFELAAQMAQNPILMQNISKLSSGEVQGRDDQAGLHLESFFYNAFGSVGVVLAADDQEWPAWYHRLVAERALAAAIEADCAGEGYFVSERDSIRLVGGLACQNLKEDRSVQKIGSYQVWSDGVRVYDFIREVCRYQTSMVMSDRNDAAQVHLLCPKLPKRARFLRFPWAR